MHVHSILALSVHAVISRRRQRLHRNRSYQRGHQHTADPDQHRQRPREQ